MERRPNPANRRSSLLALTPAGESVVSRAEPAWQAAIQEILGGAVTPDELTALSLVLGACARTLNDAAWGSRPDKANLPGAKGTTSQGRPSGKEAEEHRANSSG